MSGTRCASFVYSDVRHPMCVICLFGCAAPDVCHLFVSDVRQACYYLQRVGGYTNVRYLEGGFLGWYNNDNLPMDEFVDPDAQPFAQFWGVECTLAVIGTGRPRCANARVACVRAAQRPEDVVHCVLPHLRYFHQERAHFHPPAVVLARGAATAPIAPDVITSNRQLVFIRQAIIERASMRPAGVQKH
eukprot:1192144-Prorocentrum_minimum.AAC.1